MSKSFPAIKTCVICQSESVHICIRSAHALGLPDLDFRPAAPARFLLPYNIQRCPVCGYVAKDISAPFAGNSAFVYSIYYNACGFTGFHGVAGDFYRAYLLAKECGNKEEQIRFLRLAAWSCDDIGDERRAALCRRKAAVLLRSTSQDVGKVLRADFLRRTLQFDRLLSEYDTITVEEPLYNDIIEFELRLAREHDERCYSIQAAR